MPQRFNVITGGPGSGKTTVMAGLAAAGFRCMPEAGRAIIRDQVAIDGKALPWADREKFAELMLGWEMRSYQEAMTIPGPVFFDRGIPDVIGYLRLCRLPIPAHFIRAAELRQYGARVFIAPHWPDIYEQDVERRQGPAEAEATCEAVADAYAMLGYELLPLPLSSVVDRVAFIRSHLG